LPHFLAADLILKQNLSNEIPANNCYQTPCQHNFRQAVFGLAQYYRTKKLPVHDCMSRVSKTIWETCLSRAGPGIFQSVFLHRLPDCDCILRTVPGDFNGECGRRVG
jgi:hypothetical protein